MRRATRVVAAALGVFAGIVGTRINAPVTRRAPWLTQILAKAWPWSLIAFFVWTLGQFVAGYFFNELLIRSGYLSPLLIVGLMALAIVSAYGRDIEREAG